MRGPLAAYTEIAHAPGYYWPEDRAWCVITDIDLAWAYLGGTSSLIDEITSKAVLDAYRTAPSNPARPGMDLLNDPEGIVPRQP